MGILTCFDRLGQAAWQELPLVKTVLSVDPLATNDISNTLNRYPPGQKHGVDAEAIAWAASDSTESERRREDICSELSALMSAHPPCFPLPRM